VKIPAVYLWAVGQKAKLNSEFESLKIVRECINSSTSRSKVFDWTHVAKEDLFRKVVKDRLDKGVIPFVRDDLDLSLAALIYGQRVEFKMHSERSFVECGFLRARKRVIEYVDLAGDMIKIDSRIPEFLDADNKKLLLASIDDLSANNAFYQTVNSEECILKISGLPNLFSSLSKPFYCSISLWNGPDGNKSISGGQNRELGSAKILPAHDKSLWLTEVPAQIQLELTAGSLVGKWLLIESSKFNSFGRLPDITIDNQTAKAVVDSLQMLEKYTLGVTPMVLASQSLINKFSNRFSWFVPNDSKSWLEAIQK
jgi:hypothetical protein